MAWTVRVDYKKSSNICPLDETSLTHKDREILRLKEINILGKYETKRSGTPVSYQSKEPYHKCIYKYKYISI